MHGHPEHMEASSWLCAMRTNHGSSEEPYDEIGVEVCRNVPAIPAEPPSPVITRSAELAFRKHRCENTP